ncbi:MAG: transcriptional regulator/antitoxin MazE [Pararhodobacter sp.]|nr:transcriptional regulator/antitoxin MazE [Pararhodobacter sp.]
MCETRTTKVGNSAEVALSDEMLVAPQAREGDTVYMLPADDGCLKVTLDQPDLALALAAAQIVVNENRDMLQALERGGPSCTASAMWNLFPN